MSPDTYFTGVCHYIGIAIDVGALPTVVTPRCYGLS